MSIKIILGVDVETTGLSHGNCEIVELGLVLFNTISCTPINIFSRLYPVEKWGEEAALIHKIPKEYVDLATPLSTDPWEIIDGNMAELIVAHNAEFDYNFVVSRWPSFKKREWICTKYNLPHAEGTSHRLGHLSVDNGIPVFTWHRAANDAELCCRLAAKYDLNKALQHKKLPRYKLILKSKYNKDYIDKIKAQNFKWDNDNKCWYKDNLTEEAIQSNSKIVNEITNSEWETVIKQLPPRNY